MLKWLKQKPTHFEESRLTTHKGGNELSFDTTDDPLATFQVQLKLGKELPGKKKSKLFKSGNNKNEVYSVSRVNPLFDGSSNSLITVEKNPVGEGHMEGEHVGNHSGSSGYDSNSNTNPSDNEESEGDNQSQSHEDSGGNGTVFKDTDSDIVISRKIVTITPTEAERESPSSREHVSDDSPTPTVPVPPPFREPSPSVSTHPPPVIIHQHPGYVKSIILAMGGGKTFNLPRSDVQTDNEPTTIGRPLFSSPPLLLVPKNPNAGRPPPPPPAPPGPLTSSIPVSIHHPTNSPSASESVDDLGPVVKLVHKNSQYVQSIRICQHPQGPSSSSSSSVGSVNVGFGKPTRIKQTHARTSSAESSTGEMAEHNGGRRKPSVTFSELVDVVVDGHPENGRRRKKSSQAGDVQLEKFSTSLSKNRMVKQIISKSALPPAPDNANAADDAGDVEAESDFVYHHVSDNRIPGAESQYRARGNQSSKSPFGGIADHYAAAKEIAKEIESYSTGTTKSTKISFVRDLLLSHGHRVKASSRRNRSPPPPMATTSSYLVTPHNLLSTKNEPMGSRSGRPSQGARSGSDEERYPIIKVVDGKVSVVRQPSSSARWQVLQVQPQVYVKASDGDGDGETATTKTNGSVRTRNSNRNASEYDYANRGDEGQDQQQNQVPIYEALPSAHNSGPGNRNHDDSDSGHSTDRNASGSDAGGKKGAGSSPNGHDDCSSSSSSGDQDHPASSSSSARAGESGSSSSSVCSSGGESGKNKSKVMIISGDSQNMVVDLTAVPSELRTAIIAGTTLMQLPATTDFRQHPHPHQLEPGYTLITIPPEIRGQLGGGKGGDGDEERLQGKFSRHNLTQIWNVMQANLMGGGGDGNRKKKDVTTVLPFHPNRDAHTTPDFTLEGHRLALQAKRVRNGKRRRCLCRLCGMLVFLISFLGVIVTLSLIYTNGRKYFGSA